MPPKAAFVNIGRRFYRSVGPPDVSHLSVLARDVSGSKVKSLRVDILKGVALGTTTSTMSGILEITLPASIGVATLSAVLGTCHLKTS